MTKASKSEVYIGSEEVLLAVRPSASGEKPSSEPFLSLRLYRLDMNVNGVYNECRRGQATSSKWGSEDYLRRCGVTRSVEVFRPPHSFVRSSEPLYSAGSATGEWMGRDALSVSSASSRPSFHIKRCMLDFTSPNYPRLWGSRTVGSQEIRFGY